MQKYWAHTLFCIRKERNIAQYSSKLSLGLGYVVGHNVSSHKNKAYVRFFIHNNH